jgi:cyclophilin family peptidyl-prolyl cis-trans isomerase
MLEIDFMQLVQEKKVSSGGKYFTHKELYAVERNGELVGDLMALIDIATKEFGMEDAEIANTILFEKQAKIETAKLITARSHPSVTLQFTDSEPIGKEDPVEYAKIVVELFDDYAPKAVENFIALCTGKNDAGVSYVDCPVHRIVPGGWLQCGDVVDGSGKNSSAVVEAGMTKFEDESFSIDFGGKFGGVVGYSSSETHANGSQFFVTLGPCEWMNNTVVGFGRVVQGFRALQAMQKVPLANERPVIAITVTDSTVFTEATTKQ